MSAIETTFVESLCSSGLLSPAQLNELGRNLQPQFADPLVLARELVRRGWLTSFQANRVLSGRAASLWLGPYLLIEKIGQGEAGKVYKARQSRPNRIVAVKVLHPSVLARPDAVRRFQQQAQQAARIDHPHVVKHLEAAHVGTTYFLVSDFVAGTDLDSLVRQRGPQPIEQSVEFVRQAALGVQQAIDVGVAQRDIRPSHLLLASGSQSIKMLGLGFSPAPPGAGGDDGQTNAGRDADYAAPESELSPRADVYSLGATLYFLLTGTVPYPGGTIEDKRARHQGGRPVPVEALRPDVPPMIASVLRAMMAVDPAARPASPGEVAQQLADLTEEPAGGMIDFSMDGLVAVQPSGLTMAGVPRALAGMSRVLRPTDPDYVAPGANRQLPNQAPAPPFEIGRKPVSAWSNPVVIGVGALTIGVLLGLGGMAAMMRGQSSATTSLVPAGEPPPVVFGLDGKPIPPPATDGK